MIYQGAIKKVSVYLDIKDLNTNMTWIERIDKMIISAKSQVKRIFLSQSNKYKSTRILAKCNTLKM
jgi:hypothetical protein